jgi:hypothetical protein
MLAENLPWRAGKKRGGNLLKSKKKRKKDGPQHGAGTGEAQQEKLLLGIRETI